MKNDKKENLVSKLFKEQLHNRSSQMLEQLIISGEYEEGELLPSERQLCERFGVSRTVIREAMKILEIKGLVRIERGKGTVINRPTHEPITDALSLYMKRTDFSYQNLSEFRLIVEGEMTALAAQRATEEDIFLLREIIDDMKKNLAKEDDPEASHYFVEADDNFHMSICKASKNVLMHIVFESINDIIKPSRYLTLNEPGKARGVQEHEQILEAIKNKDVTHAKEIMRYHIIHTEKDYYRVQLNSELREP